MALPKISLYLKCNSCDRVEYCATEHIVAKLREIQMLRRNAEPDEELLRELMMGAADRLECSGCQSRGMSVSDEDPFDEEAWGDPKKCEQCSAKIPPERMEIFPDTRLCTSCQAGEERGEVVDEPDFCPRCGDIMQMRRTGGSGLAGYRMSCPSCRG